MVAVVFMVECSHAGAGHAMSSGHVLISDIMVTLMHARFLPLGGALFD